jgi:F-type H+-transporting ATPase subunit a
LRPDTPLLADTLKRAVGAVSDTVHAAASQGAPAHAEKFEFSHLLGHMRNSSEIDFPGGHLELPHVPPLHLGGLTIDLSITKHVFFMLLSALILVIVAVYAARKNRRSSVPTGFGNLVEIFVVFMRDEIALPTMGKAGLRYLPYLLTTFFFILIMNLFGLVPYGATATSNVSVTAALAFIAFVMIQVAAIRAQGLKRYFAHLTGGLHWMFWPIMIPVEVLGLFTKPFALCMRLFANMNGGHIVLLALIGLIFLFRSLIMAPVSVLFSVGISALEIFVAVLQAYIFTILTALFMGFGLQPEGHEGEIDQAH